MIFLKPFLTPRNILIAAGGLALLYVLSFAYNRIYDAGWNARDRIALQERLAAEQLYNQALEQRDTALEVTRKTMQAKIIRLHDENDALETTLKEIEDGAETLPSVPGCGIPADSLLQLDAIR